MAKSQNQKLKILYILQYLRDRSSEQNPVSTADIIDYLAKKEITAERKSVYSDIKALQDFGIDIIPVHGASSGYYIGSREFEVAELKLLVDLIQSSKFITQKKTDELIRKLKSLTNETDAKKIRRQAVSRVKSANERVYYYVDELSGAINDNHPVRFKYYTYYPDKSLRLRRGGKLYEVSPYALIWDDENYYLLCYQHDEAKMKHFRVDKIDTLEVLGKEKRQGIEEFRKIDMSSYTQKVFGMFGGEMRDITLRFANSLAGSVIDRFGKDYIFIPYDDKSFTIRVNVAISPRFYAWLLGFGTDAEIMNPPDVREKMKDYVSSVAAMYDSEKAENK